MADSHTPSNGTDWWRTFEMPPPSDEEVRAEVLRIVLKMSPDEVATSSVRAGIHLADGRLSPPYRGDR